MIQPSSEAPAKVKQKSAVVTLTISGTSYNGQSSTQYGHAEMAALRDFIMTKSSVEDAATAIRRSRSKTVSCHNQPVCGSCSLVLKALEFTSADEETEFSDEKSGGVSWGANGLVEQLLDVMGLAATYKDALSKGAK